MPSTLVALKIISASISTALRAAPVSVVKQGLPVPAEKITTFPCISSKTLSNSVNLLFFKGVISPSWLGK
jgi:hypothetical protein